MPSQLVIIILSLIVAMAIIFFVIPTVFGFDMVSLISLEPENLGDVFQEDEFTKVEEYDGYELSYEGMYLLKGSGTDSVTDELTDYDYVYECQQCSSSCHTVSFSDGYETLSCDSCSTCGGKTGQFEECYGCDASTGECTLCYDKSEYALCKSLKSCILKSYGDYSYKKATGCFLEEISHNDGTMMSMSTLRQVLNSCQEETIMVNIGNDITRELCEFDPNDISYYGITRPENYYMKHSTNSVHIDGFTSPMARRLETDLVLSPFEEQNNQLVSKYRIQVSFIGQAGNEYKIKAGTVGNMYEIGSVYFETDGLWSGDFEPSEEWKNAVANDNTKNALKRIEFEPFGFDIKGTVYSTTPQTNYIWSHDLRYSKCNFETNPELYMEDKPWWIQGNDVSSSLQKQSGDSDSAIKVFYDSSMPAGGDSNKRGNIKLQLGRLDTDFMKKCKFDIYVCSQDSFAEYEGESILDISDFLIDFNPLLIHKFYDFGNDKIALFNYFEIDLGEDVYTTDEINSAIKSGMRIWEQTMFPYASGVSSLEWLDRTNNDGIYMGDWKDYTGMVYYNNDCWSGSVENLMQNNGRYLVGNCQGGECSGKLKMRIAFKYNPASTGIEPLYPTVTFCSSGTGAEPDNQGEYEGLLGTCMEVYPVDNWENRDYCKFNWGSSVCNPDGSCSCSSGTRQTLASFYTDNTERDPPVPDDIFHTGSPWYDKKVSGYGFLIGCTGDVRDGIERPTGACTITYNTDSEKETCNDPTSTLCQGSGSSSYCSGSPKEIFDNYKWYDKEIVYGNTYMTTSKTNKDLMILGTCHEYYNVPASGTYNNQMRISVTTSCENDWGTANCDHETNECFCYDGKKTELLNGYLWNPDATHFADKPGYGRLYACVSEVEA